MATIRDCDYPLPLGLHIPLLKAEPANGQAQPQAKASAAVEAVDTKCDELKRWFIEGD